MRKRALIPGFGATSVLKKLAQNRLLIHAFRHFRLFDVDPFRSQEKLLRFFRRFLLRPEMFSSNLRRRVVQVFQTLHLLRVFRVHRRAFHLAKRLVRRGELFQLGVLFFLLVQDVLVRHPGFLRLQAVLLSGCFPHDEMVLERPSFVWNLMAEINRLSKKFVKQVKNTKK